MRFKVMIIGQQAPKALMTYENSGHMPNRSPKGNMWSAIPIALHCMILNWSKRKQGSGSKGDEVL